MFLGGFLACSTAIYRGLVGGMAAGVGSYGLGGPIWGALVGFGYFLLLGVAAAGCLGIAIAALLRHLRR